MVSQSISAKWVNKVGWCQSYKGLAGHGKEFEFYCKCSGKSFKVFRQKGDMIQFTFLTNHSGCCMDYRGGNRADETTRY